MFNSPACLAVPRETSHQAQTGLPDDTRNTLRHSIRLVTCNFFLQEKVQTPSTRNFYPRDRSFFVNAMLCRRLGIALRRAFPGIASRFGNWLVQLPFKKSVQANSRQIA
jgi:hypothetical protein